MEGPAHRRQAEVALSAAEELHQTQPMWALVPLFYSAMHLMHARFDEDELCEDKRHPEQHRSRKTNGGRVLAWGTREVVAAHYEAVSVLYRSLDTVSQMVRYKPLVNVDTGRFWSEYDRLAAEAQSRGSNRGD